MPSLAAKTPGASSQQAYMIRIMRQRRKDGLDCEHFRVQARDMASRRSSQLSHRARLRMWWAWVDVRLCDPKERHACSKLPRPMTAGKATSCIPGTRYSCQQPHRQAFNNQSINRRPVSSPTVDAYTRSSARRVSTALLHHWVAICCLDASNQAFHQSMSEIPRIAQSGPLYIRRGAPVP